MSRLEVRGLMTRHLGPVDLTVEAGECVVLRAPSGAGKTLLLRALADLDPHDGEVLLDDRLASDMPAADWRRQVAMLPAESRWWRQTVGEHFAAGVADEQLRELGFDRSVLARPVTDLSGGERQRLALLRLLANRPHILLLDEPTASLDPVNVARVESLVAAYRAAAGAAVVWVSHDPAQAARVAARCLTIREGRLEEVAL